MHTQLWSDNFYTGCLAERSWYAAVSLLSKFHPVQKIPWDILKIYSHKCLLSQRRLDYILVPGSRRDGRRKGKEGMNKRLCSFLPRKKWKNVPGWTCCLTLFLIPKHSYITIRKQLAWIMKVFHPIFGIFCSETHCLELLGLATRYKQNHNKNPRNSPWIVTCLSEIMTIFSLFSTI